MEYYKKPYYGGNVNMKSIEARFFELTPLSRCNCLAIMYAYGQCFIITDLEITDIHLPNHLRVDKKKHSIKGLGHCFKVITPHDVGLIHYLYRSGK